MHITRFETASKELFETRLESGALDAGTLYLVTESGGEVSTGTSVVNAELYIGNKHIVDFIIPDDSFQEVMAHALCELDARVTANKNNLENEAVENLVNEADGNARLLDLLKSLRMRVGLTSPLNSITPRFIGEEYFQNTGVESTTYLWIATGLSNSNWTKVSKGSTTVSQS